MKITFAVFEIGNQGALSLIQGGFKSDKESEEWIRKNLFREGMPVCKKPYFVLPIYSA